MGDLLTILFEVGFEIFLDWLVREPADRAYCATYGLRNPFVKFLVFASVAVTVLGLGFIVFTNEHSRRY